PGIARDDGARMTHPFPRRRRPTADEADHWLTEAGADHLVRRQFLVAASDLADHDHRPGGRVVLEEPQDLFEGKPEDRIAADPHRGGLANPRLAQPLDDFVGEGAAPRYDAHRSLAIDVVGDDPHLRPAP